MSAFIRAHAKAISGFLTAEASSVVTVLTTVDHPVLKTWVIALLLPFTVGVAVHKPTNTPKDAQP